MYLRQKPFKDRYQIHVDIIMRTSLTAAGTNSKPLSHDSRTCSTADIPDKAILLVALKIERDLKRFL